AATAAEVVAIRRLEAARRRGACQVQPSATQTKPAAVTTTTPKTASTPTPATPTPATPATPATTPAPAAKSTGGSSSGSTTGLLEVLVPALLVLAFAAGISLEMNRRPGR
ncbi:MAG TPA: hypothetical protein VFR49_10540, partial [Solirubrobacteraceae bacterium]|nr:hypothetical protein [Solirubrobacteraceae bacterium]